MSTPQGLSAPGEPVIAQGTCHALLAFDIGAGIDLEKARQRLSAKAEAERQTIKHMRRAAYFELRPAPVRVTFPAERVVLAGHGGDDWSLEPVFECLIFDFGAVSVSYRAPLSGRLSDLLRLSELIYDNPSLLADAQKHLRELVGMLGEAVSKPSIADTVETYVIFEVNAVGGETSPAAAAELPERLLAQPELLARILRSEADRLSPQEVADALSSRVSYGPGDAVVIDWNAAVVIDRAEEAEDVRTVLEYANVELLEMRVLDDRLDETLDDAYRRVAERDEQRWPRMGPWRRRGERQLRRIARMQMDSALLFEGVNNALKLIGDQYLARVYRLAAQRFHLTEHDASIERKLRVLEDIYDKMRDHQTTLRMEVLEWIIIILIAFEVVMGLMKT